MAWLWLSLLDVVQVVQPETLLRWHWAGFRILALEVTKAGRAAKD
jgi:hypothetical protein